MRKRILSAVGSVLERPIALLSISAAASLLACSPQSDTQTAQAINQLSEKLNGLEARLTKVESTAASRGEPWILWHAEINLTNPLNGVWPTAEAGYPTKEGCLTGAGRWSLPDGKQMGDDPVIWQSKTWRLTVRCLPKGVDPILRH